SAGRSGWRLRSHPRVVTRHGRELPLAQCRSSRGKQPQGPGISTTKCRRYGTALADMASPRVRATSAPLATERRPRGPEPPRMPGRGALRAAGGKNVETPHPVETSHAYSVFYFRRMQSFHANRAARLRWPDRYLAHGSQGHHASPQLTELADISHRHCPYRGRGVTPWKHNAAMRQRTRAHKRSVIYPPRKSADMTMGLPRRVRGGAGPLLARVT